MKCLGNEFMEETRKDFGMKPPLTLERKLSFSGYVISSAPSETPTTSQKRNLHRALLTQTEILGNHLAYQIGKLIRRLYASISGRFSGWSQTTRIANIF
ncbi:hypothetical protein Tco_1473961 [Tanacetum coccineum]